MFERYNGNGLTAKDILELAKYIKDRGISKDIPVMISEHKEGVMNNALDLKADRESIVFYDWI